MRCSTCGTESLDTALYCGNCGSKLKSACPGCNALNPAGNSFCQVCGTALTPGGWAEAPAAVVFEQAGASAGLRCPRCDKANEPGSIYCYDCGFPLDDREDLRASALHMRQQSLAGRPGGFWIRLVATIINYIIVFAVAVPLTYLIFPDYSLLEVSSDTALWDESDTVNSVLALFYWTLSVGIWGTTIGKKAFGLRVVRPDGSKIGIGRAFCRYLCYTISLLTLLIGYLMIAFRADKRGLHDLICDTMVIRK
jgi:uncharacterized RDD family membrane protein YckC